MRKAIFPFLVAATVMCTAHAFAATPPTDASTSSSAWLDRIEAKADQTHTLQAKLTYIRIQGLLGDKQTRYGQLIYQAAQPAHESGESGAGDGPARVGDGPARNVSTPAQFAIHFDRLAADGQLTKQKRSYIFDGRWLAERHDDEKVFIRRQLVAADQPAANLLDATDGPFILPLDLKKDKVLARFNVKVEQDDAQPDIKLLANTVHLRLTPKPDTHMEQTQVDMWFNRDTLLPVRVRTIDRDESISDIFIRDPHVNVRVDPRAFDTTPPHESGWEVEIKPLKEGVKGS